MSMDSLVRLTYWAGWISVVVAFLYKLLIAVDVINGVAAAELNVLPRHFWQLSFLLFLICIASEVQSRKQSS